MTKKPVKKKAVKKKVKKKAVKKKIKKKASASLNPVVEKMNQEVLKKKQKEADIELQFMLDDELFE